jgi:hypothetical protein
MVHVKVSSEHTPEHTLECGHAGTLNGASDKPVITSVMETNPNAKHKLKVK